MNSYKTIHPSSEVSYSTHEEIVEVIQSAKRAQKNWRNTPISERIRLLGNMYDLMIQEKESLAQSVTLDMGMPIKLARDDVQYGLNYFFWYLQNAEKSLSSEIVFESDSEIHTVFYEPKGVIAAITPWNYPCMLFVWACIQPLLAGNTVVWKISKEAINTGWSISNIIRNSWIPEGILTEIYGDGAVGDFLTDQNIDGITFTGSTYVWERLAEKALSKKIPCLLELGGSAPGIICEDADIDDVLETIYFLRFSNSGQMCDGLKRLIVHHSRYDELIEKLSQKLTSKKIWDPLDETTDIGPMVSEKQKVLLMQQFDDALTRWATTLFEKNPDWDISGDYVPLMLLGNITRDMRVWKEEVFGPILPVITYTSEQEAIDLANDTIYGLWAYVFTRDWARFHRIASQIQSGMVQLNNINYCIPSDPFGGYKVSGIGREHGKSGFREMCNMKVISEPKNL